MSLSRPLARRTADAKFISLEVDKQLQDRISKEAGTLRESIMNYINSGGSVLDHQRPHTRYN